MDPDRMMEGYRQPDPEVEPIPEPLFEKQTVTQQLDILWQGFIEDTTNLLHTAAKTRDTEGYLHALNIILRLSESPVHPALRQRMLDVSDLKTRLQAQEEKLMQIMQERLAQR